MRVDWSKAEVIPDGDDNLRLRVRLVDVRGAAYEEAFAREVETWKASLGDERRNVSRYGTGSSAWSVEIWPIDANDVDGERRQLEEFVERVNRAAEPAQAKLDEQARREREAREERDRRAAELTDRFRQE